MNYDKNMETARRIIDADRKKTDDRSWSAHLLTKEFEFELLFSSFAGTKLLELGSAGHLLTTRILVSCGYSVHLADIEDRSGDIPQGASFTKSDWISFAGSTTERFSDILFVHGLEHIEDGEKLLTSLKNALLPGGRLHIIVPNALSLHRLIGAELGMLETPYSLNENDRRNGHVRMYDIQTLAETVNRCGYHTVKSCGIQIKPLTDAELFDKGDEYIRAMNRLSGRFTEYCSELYICAEAD